MAISSDLIAYLECLRLSGGDRDGERFRVLPWQRRFVRGVFSRSGDAAVSVARATASPRWWQGSPRRWSTRVGRCTGGGRSLFSLTRPTAKSREHPAAKPTSSGGRQRTSRVRVKAVQLSRGRPGVLDYRPLSAILVGRAPMYR